MKRLMLLLAALALLTAPALGEQEHALRVTEERLLVAPDSQGFAGIYSAKVENTGTEALYAGDSLFELLDKDGNVWAGTDMLPMQPFVVQPGESAYVSVILAAERAATADAIAGHRLELRPTAVSFPVRRLPVTAQLLPAPEGDGGVPSLEAAVTNDTKDALRGINIAFALYDQEGKLLYAQLFGSVTAELPAGETKIFSVNLRMQAAALLQEQGIPVSRVDAIAAAQ